MGNQVLNRPVVASADARTEQLRTGSVVRSIGRVGLFVSPMFAYFFLWAPILLLVIFSFNDSDSIGVWRGVTFRWYENIFSGTLGREARFATEQMLGALGSTITVGILATLISTVIGTMVALSLARGRFPGKRILDAILFLPVVIPEITQGVSLAIFFKILFDFLENSVDFNAAPGLATIIAGHVAFNISYVAIVVRARLANMNPRLEEAANDLGANAWQTFRRITLPLIMPGVIAGALLALTLSMDDLVVTYYNAGTVSTLPMFVYSLIKTSVTPEVNALSTLMLVFSTLVIGVSLYLQNKYTDRPYTRR